ncbi:MAG: hypothetical protein P9L92_05525 [Candidatus Electryonea clarkiae]|nr:hypothetical protein [Candidatus Electryonea clarkiae]MDP8286707.1 hypothetical protein [Candidatus Electryonea clarkiae]
MKRQYLKTAKYLKKCIDRLETIQQESDLPDLHRLSVEMMNYLPEAVVHENSVLFLNALKVNREADISEYCVKAGIRLGELYIEYLNKKRTPSS